MSDWSPILCVGRGYPNAPYQSRMGHTGRGGPFWFVLSGQQFGPRWPPAGTPIPIRWSHINTLTGINAQNQWVYESTHTPNALNIWVFTETAVAGFRLRLQVHDIGMGSGGGGAAQWVRNYGSGFPTWDPIQLLTMNLLFDGGWYGGSAPAQMILRIGSYANMPPGVCIPPVTP